MVLGSHHQYLEDELIFQLQGTQVPRLGHNGGTVGLKHGQASVARRGWQQKNNPILGQAVQEGNLKVYVEWVGGGVSRGECWWREVS
jgi:hypothetical protein